MRAALTIALLVATSNSLFAQAISQEVLRRILIAQDRRDVTTLRQYLNDTAGSVRAKAAFACGSVQDTSLMSRLEELLHDSDVGVREGCAFALGQLNFAVDSIARRRISSTLLIRLKHEENEEVASRVIEALGKLGDPGSLAEFVLAANSTVMRGLREEFALSIGRYAYRGIKSEEATSFAVHVLTEGHGWKAAYALFRIGNKDLLAPHIRQIMEAASDQDPNVRMYVASVLGKVLPSSPDPGPILTLLRDDPDWRVRVNAVKALSSFAMSASSRKSGIFLKTVNDTCEHVSLAALSAIGAMTSNHRVIDEHILEVLQLVVTNADGRFSERQRREAAIAFASLKGPAAFDLLTEWRKNGTLSKPVYVQTLGHVPSDDALQTLIDEAHTVDSRIQRLALEGMLSSCALRPPSDRLLSALRSSLMDALSSRDNAVITTAAGALSESLFVSPICIPKLIDVLEGLRASTDAEPIITIIQSLGNINDKLAVPKLESFLRDPNPTVAREAASALRKITGKSYRTSPGSPKVESHSNFDWALLDSVRTHPVVIVETSRGVFKFKMLPDEAPFTCINFASLIKRRFFDGLVFHRVVPNFVVQGGDPRGDGWGGPGYSIRSEFGYQHYERGAVGVASSGKDTEGSQFFVTHSNQPHLDGRYTIFASVTDGMDVVDRMQVGDTIGTMTLADH